MSDATTPLLRPATLADVPALLAVKEALPMPAHDTRSGGFLLGASAERYHLLVAHGLARVLVDHGELVGFAIALPDPLLRASELWQRRTQIAWDPDFDPDRIAAHPVAYFDQIAVLPRARAHAAALALRVLVELVLAGHRHVLTTTVVAPIKNLAALPFLARVGARAVGHLAERYPDVGAITSAIHHIDADAFLPRLDAALADPSPALRRLVDLALPPELASGIRDLEAPRRVRS